MLAFLFVTRAIRRSLAFHPLVFGVLLVCSTFLLLSGLAAAGEYVIGPGDSLHISVWGNEQLDRTILVRPDGQISFPLLHELQVGGLTPMQLRDVMMTKLKDYVRTPNVTVTVTEINSFKVFVQGEVARPGMQTLHQEMTLLHLISMVGGITEHADLAQAYLLRGHEKVSVDFYRLLKEGDLSQNLTLKPNDLIFIPDNFDARITVVGEVNEPKIIAFREGITVLDVIMQAGSFTMFARRNKSRIVRRNGGNPEIIPIAIYDIMRKGQIDKNIPLQPGDIIVVP